ncbi:GNAT family N-acetyltransferase, partial [Pantoea sp.]|uniref:GNAT family N-acetyltransferase n=1 Tax=Pantoea sp. TaxID=69393 RepID=UPI0028A08F50
MSMTLRPMQAGDIGQAFALTQKLKWPHRREDWQQALALGEGIVALEQDQVIGSAIAWRWGDDYATIGLVIVDDRQQGRGIGKQLMLTLLERLSGYNVRLHATEMGRGLYEKLGFVATGRIKQLQTRARAAPPPLALPAGLQLRRAAPQDAQRLTLLD